MECYKITYEYRSVTEYKVCIIETVELEKYLNKLLSAYSKLDLCNLRIVKIERMF